MDNNIKFAKIVSTPTLTSWSQAYNAGNLYAVLSLVRKEEPLENDEPLGKIGKQVFNTLESEYFALENKSLALIKEALEKTVKEIPENIFNCLVIASFVKPNVLYAFISGEGRITLKRNEKLGNIIETKPEEQVNSASGFLEDGDLVILETQKFSEIVNEEFSSDYTPNSSPSEISETLAPKIHQKEEGGASAIILSFKETVEEKEAENEEEIILPQQKEKETFFKKIKIPDIKFSHKNKMLLTISFVLLIVLFSSIFFTLQKQKDEKITKRFNEIYALAENKHKEGESLLSLNKNLAKDDLLEAQKILINGKSEFGEKSKETQKITALLRKIESSLEQTKGVNNSDLKPVDKEKSVYLSFEIDNGKASLFSFDEKYIYFLENENINSFEKAGKKNKVLIENNKDWKKPVAVNAYFDNLYLLDKNNNQIFKFVKLNNGFSKTNYLKDSSIDLSLAADMTIDGSIYVLITNGNVLKFTKGAKESFKLSGLETPLKNPTKIYTNLDIKNIYVLDTGNSRIVVFGKDGGYQAQYQNSMISEAKDFEILENDKSIYLLIKNKVYQLDLK